ncbi:MraY family glycosyltransferase [Nocardioides sp. Bht2]|uniref:MraY family glycosyltransferase n=1 Tax=Nocardioides sp. Bht2 TaxID=3392297 RepID=UPI0039B4FE00
MPLNDARNVLICAGIMWIVGLVDDVLDLSALVKLAGQVVTGCLLVVFQIQVFTLPAFGGGQLSVAPSLSALVTVVLAIMAINAVNFMDGLDGLAAGVVGAGAAGLFIYSYSATLGDHRSTLVSASCLLTAALVGSCLGFLYHNAWPARIFMGDAGSQMLGVVLIASAFLAMSNEAAVISADELRPRAGVLMWFALPIAIAGLPLFDLAAAVIRRAWRGQSIFVADQGHLHHVLLRRGASHRSVSLLLTGWALTVSCGAAWIAIDPKLWKAIALGACLIVLFSVHEHRRWGQIRASLRAPAL